MSSKTKIEVLMNDIHSNLSFFEKRKDKNKKRAYKLKLASITSSALVTLLLGFRGVNVNLFSNIALFFAALITIFNGIEGFYNHKELWFKDVKTLSDLKALKREVEFSIAGEPEEPISPELLTHYKNKLQHILNEDVNTWSKMKESQEQQTADS